MPASSEDDVSFATASGGRLEDVYDRSGVRPTVTHVSNVKDLFDTMVSNLPPTLLHVVAGVREGSGGTYLDFASTSHRLESLDFGSNYGEASLTTASFLSSLLGSLPRPPFVILDITHPHNSAEAIRMLLLRNIFATELFDFGKTRGILGCGLALPEERIALSAVVVDALLADRVTAPIRGLRAAGAPDDLDHILPRQGAALWTNDPEDRLFVP
jgi:hypothetical protein